MVASADFWMLICSIGLATFLIRYSFFYIFERYAVPDFIKTVLPFIPAAALSAIVAPHVFGVPLAMNFAAQPRFVAWLGAMLIAWRTKNIFLTIASGLVLLWVLEWLL